MTLPELYERIAALPTGLYVTVDSRFNKGDIYSRIHSARAEVIKQRWSQDLKIPYVCYQPLNPSYSKLSQDSDVCYTKYYDVPPIISMKGRTGLGYVGSDGELNEFREVNGKAEMASMMNKKLTAKLRVPYIVLLGNGEIEVYYSKGKVKEFQLQAIFANPTLVNTYNVLYDQYPIDEGDIDLIERYLLTGTFRMAVSTPIDRVNDQRDITVPPTVKL